MDTTPPILVYGSPVLRSNVRLFSVLSAAIGVLNLFAAALMALNRTWMPVPAEYMLTGIGLSGFLGLGLGVAASWRSRAVKTAIVGMLSNGLIVSPICCFAAWFVISLLIAGIS